MKLFRILALFIVLTAVVAPAQADTKQGLLADVYAIPSDALPDYTLSYELCSSITDTAWTSVANLNFNFDADYGGIVAGCRGDFVMIHYYGYITLPVSGQVDFLSMADDGFYLSIGEETVIDNWYLKGCSGGGGSHQFEAGISQKIDVWFYEWGGGACSGLEYSSDGASYATLPDSAFSYDPQVLPEPEPFLNAPQNVVAVADGTNIDVSWDAPLGSNCAVERYALIWNYALEGKAIASTTTTGRITDLPENTDVTVLVRADNDSLSVYSQYSQPVIVRTGTKPIIVPPPIDPPIDPEPPVVPEPPIVPEPEPTDTPQPLPEPPVEPKPLPEPIEPLPPINEPVSLENLANIDASELTQAEQFELKAEAYAVFAVAEEGSPEYEQALDALFLIAQADDAQLDPAIASIPLLGNLAGAFMNAFNFGGNIGADMAPATRKKAKKVVVSAIVVGQIAISAVATSIPKPPTAPSAPSAPTESGSLNRKNKE